MKGLQYEAAALVHWAKRDKARLQHRATSVWSSEGEIEAKA